MIATTIHIVEKVWYALYEIRKRKVKTFRYQDVRLIRNSSTQKIFVSMHLSTNVKMKNHSKYGWQTFFSQERVCTSEMINDDVRNTDNIVERPVDIVVPIPGTIRRQIIRKKYILIRARSCCFRRIKSQNISLKLIYNRI